MADAPSLLSLPRLATLLTSLLVALSSGTNYVRPKSLLFAPGSLVYPVLFAERIVSCQVVSGE